MVKVTIIMKINSATMKNETRCTDQVFPTVLRGSIACMEQKRKGSISSLLCQWPSASSGKQTLHCVTVSSLQFSPVSTSSSCRNTKVHWNFICISQMNSKGSFAAALCIRTVSENKSQCSHIAPFGLHYETALKCTSCMYFKDNWTEKACSSYWCSQSTGSDWQKSQPTFQHALFACTAAWASIQIKLFYSSIKTSSYGKKFFSPDSLRWALSLSSPFYKSLTPCRSFALSSVLIFLPLYLHPMKIMIMSSSLI